MANYPQGVDNKHALEFTTSPRRITSWLPIVLVGIGILLLIGSILTQYVKGLQTTSTGQIGSGGVPSPVTVSTNKIVKVDVAGAVEQPGVYSFPNDSRVQDVLIAAGGLSAKADRNYVSHTINLAQKLSDGQKIYIPALGESSLTVLGAQTSAAGGLVNLNSASVSELDALSGIGPATAGKIIQNRPYSTPSELVTKKVISASLFDRIKDKLTTY